MNRLAVFFALVLVALSLLGVSSAAVVPLAGSLDPSFGSGGVVTHSLGSGEYPRIGGIAVQPDGKIVVAGGPGLLLARYLRDGSPDPSFGDGGYVETPVGDGVFAQAVAVERDGKIVVAGGSYQGNAGVLSEFTLARYSPNGSLDTSFGADGITNTVIPEQPHPMPWAGVTALAILPGGKILAAGSVGWTGGWHIPFVSLFALVRYTSEGLLDPTFGDGGIVQTFFGLGGGGTLAGIAVQSDGRIVATGTAETIDSTAMMALARYKRDGSLDPSFGAAGKVTTRAKFHYSGGPPTLQHGKILVAGSVLARYTASGRLDTTFGKNGFAPIRVRVTGTRAADVVQKDGKILIAAFTGANLQLGDGVVARLLPNGREDTSFASRGIVPFGDEVSNLALQKDGKILVGGEYGNAWTLARLIGGSDCVVPGLRGKTVSKARTSLNTSYCRRGHISKRFSSKVIRGRVISTAPPRGTRLPSGAKVDLVVSRGRGP